MSDIFDEYVHLVRLALEGRHQDITAIARRSVKHFTKSRPDLVDKIKELLVGSSDATRASRENVKQPMPVDIDSRLELLRKEFFSFEEDPVWPDSVQDILSAVIEERLVEVELIMRGLSPTRSILFVGPPGVGKTFAAKWLAHKMDKPLLTLDLAAVMSSYLGRTGNNIRAVLNYAQKNSSVLLLDEFDAIAKRRNDDSEVGELKRLVTVLLQTVDEWPPDGLLLAATNHPELLDPAVWRRFDRVIEFPYPSIEEVKYTINSLLQQEKSTEDIEKNIELLSYLLEGNSFAEVTRQINIARRESVVKKISTDDALKELSMKLIETAERNKKLKIASHLLINGYSQRKVSEILGISRDTLRKHFKEGTETI